MTWRHVWEYEHSIETTATPDAVWRHWTDMAAWPQWNDGIEKIEVDGPFTAGTTFTMTPPGDEPIHMRLTEILPGEQFTDAMDASDLLYALPTGWAGGCRADPDHLPDGDHRPGRRAGGPPARPGDHGRLPPRCSPRWRSWRKARQCRLAPTTARVSCCGM